MLPKLLGFPQHKEEEEGMTGILAVTSKRVFLSPFRVGKGGGGVDGGGTRGLFSG